MSLALHGHHILLIATLAFAVAVLTPNWYTSPDGTIKRNALQICRQGAYSCDWIFIPRWPNYAIQTIVPYLAVYCAIACASTSSIGLLLGSWYLQRHAVDVGSKWLLVLTIITVIFSFVFSCGVWSIMLTTNLYQDNSFHIRYVRLIDFSFSLWINIGASVGYLYAFFIYLIAICKSS